TVNFDGTIANGKHLVIKQNGDDIAHYEHNGTTWVRKLSGSTSKEVSISPVSGSAGTYSFAINDLSLILKNNNDTYDYNATSTFTFLVYKIDVNTAPLSEKTITIARSPAAYEMDHLTKSFFEKGVINRNYLPFTIDTDGATEVFVNKLPMK